MEKIICQLCKRVIETPDFGDGTYDYSEVYEYRGFYFHEKCHTEGTEKVDGKRKEVMETTEHSVRSQAGGEWNNGGYKTMKTDVAGSPIPSGSVKESGILKDYEDGIL